MAAPLVAHRINVAMAAAVAAPVPVPVGGAVLIPSQSIMLQAPDGLTFPATLPPRLYGLIGAAEFEASMVRCNAAFVRSWQRHLASLVMLSGFVLWAIVISQVHSAGGDIIKLLLGGFGGFIGLMFIGGAWSSYLEKKRQERLRAAVAAESAYYNGEQRAAQFGPLRVPMSWTVGTGPMQNGATDKHGRPIMVIGIQIDIGGGMIVAAAPQLQPQPQPLVSGVPFAQPAVYDAPPPFAGHYAQAPYPQPQAPYAQPTYASSYAQPAQPAPYAQEGHWQAPPAYSPQAWTAEGQPSKDPAVASPPSAQQSLHPSVGVGGVCERCARAAPNPDDRFCAACGGSIARAT